MDRRDRRWPRPCKWEASATATVHPGHKARCRGPTGAPPAPAGARDRRAAGQADSRRVLAAVAGRLCERKYRTPDLPAYEQIVRSHLVPALGSIPLTKLRPQHIQAYYSQARQSGRVDGKGGGLSAQTVLHHHRVLREASHHAVRWQLLARNPADAVEAPRPPRHGMRVLAPEGVQRLLTACADADLYAIVFVDLATGLREGELLALRWSDVDLNGGSLLRRRRSSVGS